MTKDFTHFHVSKALFLGTTMFLTSVSEMSANPSVELLRPTGPSTAVTSPQQAKQTIKGVVQDAFGPIAGANVIEKGTTNGTITDMDGNFTLDVAPNSILVITFIGYKEQQLPVNNQKTFNIKLTEDSQALDEVVVVGYGTQKKVNMSGSVTSVNVSEMAESRPLTNISTALAGTAPGVQITSSNNLPSNNGDADIKVRGQGTLNNSSPLVIIDGVEGTLNSVSPQDVETVSVLKDAASSAIYGSRAANGVILITTKQGKSGKMKLDYTGYVSFQTLDQPYEVVSDYANYMEYLNEGMANSNKPKPFSDNVINLWREKSKDPNGLNEYGMPNYLAYPNNSIFDVYETGVSHQHNISASGGSEKITYYTSFNYLNNPGILENCGFERFSLRANVDSQVKDWLKIGVNLSGYTSNTTPVSDNIDDIYTYGLTGGNPGIAYLDDQNRLGINANAEDDPQNATNNPYNRLRNVSGNIQVNTLKTRLYAVLTPLKGLTIQGSYTYDYYDKFKENKPNFVPMYNFQTNTLYTDGVGQTSIANYNEKTFRNFMDATVRYERNFFDNRLSTNLMVGGSQEQYKRQYFSGTRKDLIDPSLNVIGGAIGESSTTGNVTEWAMRSFFGRLNLGWDDKYLLEVNLRADGSSRFLADNRWGYFPSFSAAWRISEEGFMENTKNWLDNLKVRASYGSLGNNTLGDNRDNDGNYTSQSLYAQTNYVLGRAVAMGLSQTAIANAALTWETTYITNVGLDYNVLGNRLSGSVEFFNKRTEGILIDLPAPKVHGNATIPKQNSAQITNRGLEFSTNWSDKAGKDFSYNVGFNFTYIKNNVDKFKGDDYTIKDARILQEGLPIWSLYVREADRIIQTDEDLAIVQAMLDNPAVEGKVVFPYGTPQKGDILYKDLNGDGLVNDDDRTVIGNGQNPTFTYGVNLGFNWKGIDFSALIQGQAGIKDVYLSALYKTTVRQGYQLNADVIDGRWYEGRTDASYPRLLDYSDTRNEQYSDFWVTDKSYLKIRNITLGYTLPTAWSKVAYMDRVRFYGSLENFFTFTKWKGYDPEVNGIKYPTMRQVVVGVNVTF
ncbi:SusC/RagA family TonB-linked outer membrane protein [Parabacteroides chongii]|uniref:SusC/RagA family TonB-linked outer membrane protein n=1 Tax=Parabacteroides chongii TaxID=2685834 RepID=UPI00240D7921|nr:TonB-dependent receptor [Parabacteroides chongii]WFE86842.1 TonB-dependent receptor [Parabacteroides chongii]